MLLKLTKPSLAILSVLGLSACTTLGPDYVHPEQSTLPSDWPVEKAAQDTLQSEQKLQQWWQQFNDPTLNQLVEMASQQNLDLEAAGYVSSKHVHYWVFPQDCNTHKCKPSPVT